MFVSDHAFTSWFYCYLALNVNFFSLKIDPLNFNGVCMENGIKFRIEHQKFDYLFEAGIGPYPLTQELADARGYIMTNNSQSLTLEVPLFTVGYRYEVSLQCIDAKLDGRIFIFIKAYWLCQMKKLW